MCGKIEIGFNAFEKSAEPLNTHFWRIYLAMDFRTHYHVLTSKLIRVKYDNRLFDAATFHGTRPSVEEHVSCVWSTWMSGLRMFVNLHQPRHCFQFNVQQIAWFNSICNVTHTTQHKYHYRIWIDDDPQNIAQINRLHCDALKRLANINSACLNKSKYWTKNPFNTIQQFYFFFGFDVFAIHFFCIFKTFKVDEKKKVATCPIISPEEKKGEEKKNL